VIPERFVDADLAVSSGYGESKWVADRLLQLVTLETCLRPVLIRLSQVCGALNGMWNSHEWIPGIVQTVDSIRCLPGEYA
jgi:thioester reductase-like protein